MNTVTDPKVTGSAPKVEDAWRSFPGAQTQVYMDVAARGLMPDCTKAALEAHIAEMASGKVDKKAWFEGIERLRDRFARSIGATADEIAFAKNITEGLNMIAASLPWQPGDNIVMCPEIEHPANVYPWLNQQRHGVEIRMVEPQAGVLPVDAMAARIDARTRIVSAATVSFTPGFRTDLATLGRACRARGTMLVVDAAQSAGILATDVDALGIDALSCSTQKGVCGIYGMGLLYVRRERAEKIEPAYLSRFGIDLGDASEADMGFEYRLAPGARRFDVGNFNFTACVAADASLAFFGHYDAHALERYVLGLATQLRRGLADLGLPVIGGIEGPHLAHIVTVGNLGAGGHDSTSDGRMQALADALIAHGVKFSIRRGVLRFSLHAYNRPADVERVIALARDWANGKAA